MAAIVMLLGGAPAAVCSFNGHDYNTPLENTADDCCTASIDRQYSELLSVFGSEHRAFVEARARVKSEVHCAGDDFVIDASEHGWVFEIEKPGGRYAVKSEEKLEWCSYGLREEEAEHGYHRYQDLAAPDEIGGLVRCACGAEYGYSGQGAPMLMCNGDYIVLNSWNAYDQHIDGGPVTGVNLDPDRSKYIKIPASIDVERRTVYCEKGPYYPRTSGSFCMPVVQGSRCDPTRPGLQGCSTAAPDGPIFAFLAAAFFVRRSLCSSPRRWWRRR